jgi:hypothetical protein
MADRGTAEFAMVVTTELKELRRRIAELEAIVDARNVWIAPEPWHSKTSMKDGYGIWRHRDGRMDFNKYKFVDGHMVEKLEEGLNACVEDGMTHDEYVEYKYEQHAERQRDKYGESDRDEEERRLNDHQSNGG